jgi:thioredoxin reductase
MGISSLGCQFAVIGAGPYGLAAAAHLRAAGKEVRVFGKTMDFWHSHMPRGMLLRSPRNGSDIADPAGVLTLDRFEIARGAQLPTRVPLEDFVRYGHWFQRQAVPDVDGRAVASVLRLGDGFRLTLEDGESLNADNVVIATGIGSFANYPAPFAALPRELVSHTGERVNRDLCRFSGRRVVVVGAGQSAIESAALLHEAGAEVEVLVRRRQLRWLKSGTLVDWLSDRFSPLKAPGKIGPIGLAWLIEHPRLFTLLPRGLQDRLAVRAIRPAASAWLQPRAAGVTISTGRHVVSAGVQGGQVHLRLNDGGVRCADHVLLGTGYKISVARYDFLGDDLLQAVRTVNGYPVLSAGFESSAPGLYFVGAPAAYSFGPLCRFVVGTQFTARTLAHFAKKKPAARSRVAV